MNKRRTLLFYIILITTTIINISTLLNGIKQHETWLIVVGAISLALMVVAGIIAVVKTIRQRKNEAI